MLGKGIRRHIEEETFHDTLKQARPNSGGKVPPRHGRWRAGRFIGGRALHGSEVDDHYDLVAGTCRPRRKGSKPRPAISGLIPREATVSFEEMRKKEAARPDGIEARLDGHTKPCSLCAAKAFLERGIHVICDKPLTSNLDDAKK